MAWLSSPQVAGIVAIAGGICLGGTGMAQDLSRVAYGPGELAVSEIQVGNLAGAEQALMPRFADETQDPARWVNLGIVYARSGKVVEARAAFERARRLPDSDLILSNGSEASSRIVALRQIQMLDHSLVTSR